MASLSPRLLITYNTQAFFTCIRTEPRTASICNTLLSYCMILSISQVHLACSAISCFESCPHRFPAWENVPFFEIPMVYKCLNTMWPSKKNCCLWYRLVLETRELSCPSNKTERDDLRKCWCLTLTESSVVRVC